MSLFGMTMFHFKWLIIKKHFVWVSFVWRDSERGWEPIYLSQDFRLNSSGEDASVHAFRFDAGNGHWFTIHNGSRSIKCGALLKMDGLATTWLPFAIHQQKYCSWFGSDIISANFHGPDDVAITNREVPTWEASLVDLACDTCHLVALVWMGYMSCQTWFRKLRIPLSFCL